MSEKRVYIIHGWGGSPKDAWIPWVKQELKSRGYAVQAPHMPDSEHPRIDLWVGFLDGMCMDPDEQTYFVGHSIGCQTILRYIQILPEQVKVGGVICVAGWMNLANLETQEEKEIARPWITQPLRTDAILSHVGTIKTILSDTDPFNCLEENKKGFEALGADVHVLHGAGHIDSQTELPEVLQFLDDIQNKG